VSESLRSWVAAIIAPLVIVVWFVWPLVPFDHSPGEVVRALATAYALFFLSRGLAFLAYSGSRAAVHLAFVLLFSFLISFGVSIGLQDPFSSAALGALQDALWCTVAAALFTTLSSSITIEPSRKG
jgi:hypothetical protein